MYLKSILAAGAIVALAGCSSMHNEPPGAQPLEEQTLATQAADVLQRQMQQPPDKRIPQALLADARCVGVFPSFTKAAFIVGGASGHGIVVCRNQNAQGNGWKHASPAFYTLTSGSVGFQAGIQSSGVILLFLTQQGANALTQNNVKFGADIGIAAGPLGWHAGFNGAPAAVVSYQVNKSGLFAGINLNGTKLSFDRASTSDVYDNQQITGPQEVLFRMNKVPSSVDVFNNTLAQIASQSSSSAISR
ncbi:MAG TPA: lipid-binding SYLF domain-containing protein [Gammaproteobacteria bacterium]|jgi:lipid-binding SYLF domain-containing protein|nr:lipid-binding SYLF domain-containing protein [Gammaproteobacteria bacterium]